MSNPMSDNGKGLLFYCTRQDPNSETVRAIFGSGEVKKIELPCSGRVGIGEILQAISSGYEKVVVLSCGENSCVHKFGCTEAIRAFNTAINLAMIAGIDTDRIIFIGKTSD